MGLSGTSVFGKLYLKFVDLYQHNNVPGGPPGGSGHGLSGKRRGKRGAWPRPHTYRLASLAPRAGQGGNDNHDMAKLHHGKDGNGDD